VKVISLLISGLTYKIMELSWTFKAVKALISGGQAGFDTVMNQRVKWVKEYNKDLVKQLGFEGLGKKGPEIISPEERARMKTENKNFDLQGKKWYESSTSKESNIRVENNVNLTVTDGNAVEVGQKLGSSMINHITPLVRKELIKDVDTRGGHGGQYIKSPGW
jgi:hypothetical protein